MSNFDDDARRLTHELRASAARAPLRRSMPDFGAPEVERSDRHFAVELLVAGVLAAAVVAIILALPRQRPPSQTPIGTTAPVVSAPATPSPTPTSGIQSTVSAVAPLVLYPTGTSADGFVTFAVRRYSGQSAGVLVVPYNGGNGYEVAPNGAYVLDGDEIIAVDGKVLGTIAGNFGQLPIWADDSMHLCGVSASGGAEATGTLLEFDETGQARTVATFGPLERATSAWQVLACSPAANRAVVVQENGTAATIIVVQLSTGRVIAQHSAGDASWGSPAASHDGGIVALNEPSGITIRNSMTWAVLGSVVRWGSQADAPLIGAAVKFSWDGSRVIVDGGGAGGGFHPEWMVNWMTGRNVATDTGAQPQYAGFDDAIPLPAGSAFFLPPTDVTADPTAAYILDSGGHLEKLSG
jgi:hypothetical protein